MSVSTQLEQIQKKKAELKNELQSMEHKERGLGESIKVLEEKMMIHDLEERVKAKRAIVERLEFRKRDLEKRLKEPQKKPEPSPVPHMPTPTPAPHGAEKTEEPQRREPMEVTVSAAPAGNQHPKQSAAPAGPQQPKKPEEKKEKKEEKKKRKWF